MKIDIKTIAGMVDHTNLKAEAFVSCIANDTEPRVTGHDGKMALRLVDHALRSYLEKKSVNIEE